MLTRAGVARRLRKSIATVRRMEGLDLHPTVDGHGVHYFDVREVDAVRSRRPDSGERPPWPRARDQRRSARPTEYEDAGDLDEERASSEAVEEARRWAEQARADARAIREERDRASIAPPKAVPSDTAGDLELTLARQALIDELVNCDDRVLRRLSRREAVQILKMLSDD
jgi:hypothetical protein